MIYISGLNEFNIRALADFLKFLFITLLTFHMSSHFPQTPDLEMPPYFCVSHKMHLNLELNERE